MRISVYHTGRDRPFAFDYRFAAALPTDPAANLAALIRCASVTPPRAAR
jgi:hypothetical protein